MTGFSYRTGHLMFYVLYRVLGETTFDRLMSGYFDQYRERGSDTQQFADYFIDNSPIDIAAVFEDWLFTPRWFQRLGSTETMRDLVASYR